MIKAILKAVNNHFAVKLEKDMGSKNYADMKRCKILLRECNELADNLLSK